MINNKITLFVLSLLFSGSNQANFKADEIINPDSMNDTIDPDVTVPDISTGETDDPVDDSDILPPPEPDTDFPEEKDKRVVDVET